MRASFDRPASPLYGSGPAKPAPLGWAGMAVILGVAIALGLAMYLTAPRHGEFWWSDAPRHALNGLFVKDLVRDLPLDRLQDYAIDYYLQYPALTILFYPPMLYAVLAVFYAALGDSQVVAQLCVATFHGALVVGSWLLFRRWLDFWWAGAAAIVLAAAPVVALWGRQVMLEIPTLAFAMWSLLFLLRHVETGRIWNLTVSLILLLAAIYTKISICFLGAVFLLVLWRAFGLRELLRPRYLVLAAAFLVLLVPLAVLTLKFGQANIQSVTGIQDRSVERWSIEGWIWYLQQLPEQMGWTVPIAAALGLVVAPFLGRREDGPDWAVLLVWFVVGYVFFSLIDLKEARHSIFILPPVALAAAFLGQEVARPIRLAWLAPVVAIGYGAYAIYFHPVPRLEGYREAAQRAAQIAPSGDIVLFSGYRDGAFVYNMRTATGRPDLTTLRADKLLLEISVRRELGVKQQSYSEAEIAELIDSHGVHTVVAQTDFWTDLEQMAKLQNVLRSAHFEEVARIPIRANIDVKDKELVVYRNLGPVAEGERRLSIKLPIIGRKLEGTVGGSP